MARIESEDLLNSSYSITADGVRHVRAFLVVDVDGPPHARLRRAAEAPGIPRRGDPHPDVPGISVIGVDPEVTTSGEQFIVRCEYAVPTEDESATSESGVGETEWTVTVVSEQTQLDIDGTPMVVRYNGRPSFFTGSGLAGGLSAPGFYSAVNIVTAEVDRPIVRATVRKRDNESIRRLITFMGRGVINDTEWSGFAPRTWLLAGVRRQRTGDGFMRYYDFLYNPDDWRWTGVIRLGQPFSPLDQTLGNGIERFRVYNERDFNELGVRLT